MSRKFLKIIVYALIHFFVVGVVAQVPNTRQGIGPEQHYYPVRDMRADFQVFNEANEAYIPYIDELHADAPAISAFVDLESNRHYKLLISTKQPGYLFINAALKYNLTAGGWRVLDIDSLYRAYRRPQIFLTIYGAPGATDKSVFIGYPKSLVQKPVLLSDDALSVRPRPSSVYDTFFSMGLLFLLASHAFLFVLYKREFLAYYNVSDLLQPRIRDDSFLSAKSFNSSTLAFTLNLSFLVAYLLLFVQSRNVDLFASRAFLPDGQKLPTLIIDFFLISGYAFTLLIAKYLVLTVLGSLYKLDDVVNVHFVKVLQADLLFYVVVALLGTVVVYNLGPIDWLSSYVLVPFVGFYIVRLGLLYLVISSMVSVKNLYLFSYLCLVELIPLLVGVRFAH